MGDLTTAQKKAIIALYFLHQDHRAVGFRRWDIGRIAKSDCSSYPIKTMRALQRLGLAEPLEPVAADLVESGQCRCGCDMWRITPAGWDYASKQRIQNAPDDTIIASINQLHKRRRRQSTDQKERAE